MERLFGGAMTDEMIDGQAIQFLASKARGFAGTFKDWLVARGFLDAAASRTGKLVVLTEEAIWAK